MSIFINGFSVLEKMFSTEREKLDREHVMEIANIEVHGTSSEVKIFEQYLQYWVLLDMYPLS